MKEKIKIVVLIVIFIGVLILTNNLLNKSNQVQNMAGTDAETNISIKENKTNVKTSVISSFNGNNTPVLYAEMSDEKTGEVFEVTEETFEEVVLNSKNKVLIEFYADWCGPCKTLSPILEEIAKENLDLKVVKINVDTNPKIASLYGTNYIPLLVVMKYGQELDSAVGALSKNEILELVK